MPPCRMGMELLVGMRIPVVEEEERLAAALRRWLEAEGSAVVVPLDGDDGLRLSPGRIG